MNQNFAQDNTGDMGQMFGDNSQQVTIPKDGLQSRFKHKVVFDSDFQQYFSYIVAVSFIGGGNWSTWRKPLTCRKSMTNFYHIILYRVHLA